MENIAKLEIRNLIEGNINEIRDLFFILKNIIIACNKKLKISEWGLTYTKKICIL